MTPRSYFRKLISWIPVEIAPHDREPNYFDFVTYFGLFRLSMGTIASLDPSAKDNSTDNSAHQQSHVGG